MKNDYYEIEHKIAKKIKLERNKQGLSQQESALKSGLDKNTVWKTETCRISPTTVTLVKISNGLDVNFFELLDVSKVEL